MGTYGSESQLELNGELMRIGIVVSRFNRAIGEGLLEACLGTLIQHAVKRENVSIVKVPGALEAPLALQRLAQTGKFDALIALGAVIRGETCHFDLVANESCAGLMSVQLDTGIPIANGILTTEDEDQAIARISEKGAYAARVAIEMAKLMKSLDEG
jgi:6,7-dimethyl-8-ribityllumazine synthase